MKQKAKVLSQLRRRAQTDLFWLATKVLGYDFFNDIHGPICDFFVKKDPRKAHHEQDDIKQRLLLYPRGHFKTTIDIADTIQWILVNPDIRILLMLGTRELATRKLAEVKHHFLHNKVLRTLFPEYCPTDPEDFGTQEEFTVPCRKKKQLREPTVSISTVDSVKAGSHYDVVKCDDLVHENNVGTKEQIEKAIQAFHYTTPLLDPGGYRDVIGTRYDFSDLYGSIIDAKAPGWKVLVRAAWEPQADGTFKLLFPQRRTKDNRLVGFTVDMLKQIRQENPYLFNCQYLNNPLPTDSPYFTPELIQRHTIPAEQIPSELRIFITWDIASTTGKQSDYTVGAVGGYDNKGNLFVIDLIRGRMEPHQIVDAVINSVIRWRPIRVGIEKAAGANLLAPALQTRAVATRTFLQIDWLPVSPKQRKEDRIAGLQALLKQNKLWFNANISDYESLMEEFCKFPKYKHNDIPDAISRLLEYQNRVDMVFFDNDIEETITSAVSNPLGNELGAGIIG